MTYLFDNFTIPLFKVTLKPWGFCISHFLHAEPNLWNIYLSASPRVINCPTNSLRFPRSQHKSSLVSNRTYNSMFFRGFLVNLWGALLPCSSQWSECLAFPLQLMKNRLKQILTWEIGGCMPMERAESAVWGVLLGGEDVRFVTLFARAVAGFEHAFMLQRETATITKSGFALIYFHRTERE